MCFLSASFHVEDVIELSSVSPGLVAPDSSSTAGSLRYDKSSATASEAAGETLCFPCPADRKLLVFCLLAGEFEELGSSAFRLLLVIADEDDVL